MRLHLHVEESFGLEVGRQGLSPLLDRFLVNTNTLVNGEQRLACPGPNVGALNVYLDRRSRNDVEMNVGAIGVGVVLRSR